MSDYVNCVWNQWTGFIGKETCEAGYLQCAEKFCPMYTPLKREESEVAPQKPEIKP